MFKQVIEPFFTNTSCGFSKLFRIPVFDDALLYVHYLLILSILESAGITVLFVFLIQLLMILLAFIKAYLEGKRSFEDFQKVFRPYLPELEKLAKRFIHIVFLYILFILLGHLLSVVSPSQIMQLWKMWNSPVVLEINPPSRDPNNKTWIQIIFRF